MDSRNTVKRAFDLAQAGRVQDLEQLRRALKSEGYDAVESHLAGMAIRKQLRTLLAEAALVQRPVLTSDQLKT